MSVDRPDLQIVLYRGQFRIGYADEHHADLDQRIGIVDIDPLAWDWEHASSRMASLPKRKMEYV